MKKVFFSLMLFCSVSLYGQTENTMVGIWPFGAASSKDSNTAAQLKDFVVKILSQKKAVTVIDRSNDDWVTKELNKQIREESVNGKGLAEQGRLNGAQQILTGNVNKVSITEKNGKEIDALKETRYSAEVTFSLTLTDVATGNIIANEVFDGNTLDKDKIGGVLGVFGGKNGDKMEKGADLLMAFTREEAIKKTIATNEKKLKEWFYEIFPSPVNIVQIAERKKGLPEKIYAANLDESFKEKSSIYLFETSYMDGLDGKKYKHLKHIATLKILKHEGELTLCKVTKGEDVLEEKIKSGLLMKLSTK